MATWITREGTKDDLSFTTKVFNDVRAAGMFCRAPVSIPAWDSEEAERLIDDGIIHTVVERDGAPVGFMMTRRATDPPYLAWAQYGGVQPALFSTQADLEEAIGRTLSGWLRHLDSIGVTQVIVREVELLSTPIAGVMRENDGLVAKPSGQRDGQTVTWQFEIDVPKSLDWYTLKGY